MDFSFGNKNDNTIYLNTFPLDLTKRKLGYEVYNSDEFILNFYWKQIQYTYVYYIFDEIGYVKEAKAITNNTTHRIEFNVDTEYFIASKFASSQKNLIIDKLLYGINFKLWYTFLIILIYLTVKILIYRYARYLKGLLTSVS